MKTTLKVFLLGMVVYPMVCSAQVNVCDAKRSSIEKEIAYAQTHGNAKRVDGLETALAQINANCSDAVLRSDAQRKVDEAHAELERVLTQASQ